MLGDKVVVDRVYRVGHWCSVLYQQQYHFKENGLVSHSIESQQKANLSIENQFVLQLKARGK